MVRDVIADALERIRKRATPHPDDTPDDRRRDLYHIQSIAAAALKEEREAVK